MIWLHATLTFSLLPQMHITTNDPTLKKKKTISPTDLLFMENNK